MTGRQYFFPMKGRKATTLKPQFLCGFSKTKSTRKSKNTGSSPNFNLLSVEGSLSWRPVAPNSPSSFKLLSKMESFVCMDTKRHVLNRHFQNDGILPEGWRGSTGFLGNHIGTLHLLAKLISRSYCAVDTPWMSKSKGKGWNPRDSYALGNTFQMNFQRITICCSK